MLLPDVCITCSTYMRGGNVCDAHLQECAIRSGSRPTLLGRMLNDLLAKRPGVAHNQERLSLCGAPQIECQSRALSALLYQRTVIEVHFAA